MFDNLGRHYPCRVAYSREPCHIQWYPVRYWDKIFRDLQILCWHMVSSFPPGARECLASCGQSVLAVSGWWKHWCHWLALVRLTWIQMSSYWMLCIDASDPSIIRYSKYQTVQELKDTLIQVWQEIRPDTICWLIRSLPRRCWECIQACRSHTVHVTELHYVYTLYKSVWYNFILFIYFILIAGWFWIHILTGWYFSYHWSFLHHFLLWMYIVYITARISNSRKVIISSRPDVGL